MTAPVALMILALIGSGGVAALLGSIWPGECTDCAIWDDEANRF